MGLWHMVKLSVQRIRLLFVVLLVCSIAVPLALVVPSVACATAKPTVVVTRANTGKVTLKKGSKYKLAAKASAGKLTYKSSKPKVASVSKAGVLKALRPGTTVVTVTAKSGKVTAAKRVKVTVVAVKKYKQVKRVTAKAASATLVPGGTTKVIAAFTPKNASNKNVLYKSSAPAVASVSASGVVKARKAGTAKITVTSCVNAKAKATVTITVKKSKPEPEPDDPEPQHSSPVVSVPGTEDLDPNDIDTDSDGYPDWIEETYMGTDPASTDGSDGISDKVVYTEGVTVADKQDANVTAVTSSDWDNNVVVTFTGSCLPEVGQVFVAGPSDACPGGVAVKVGSVTDNGDGTVTLSGTKPDISEVIDYSHVSETLEPDWDHVEAAQGVAVSVGDATLAAQSEGDSETALSTQAKPEKQITFTFGDWGPETTFIDAQNGILMEDSEKLSGQVVVNVDAVHLDWDAYPVLKFNPLGAAMGTWVRVGVNFSHVDLHVDGDAKVDVKVSEAHSTDLNKAHDHDDEYTIGKVPIFGGLGEGVYLKVNLHFEKSGEVLVEYTVDYDVDAHYKEGEGPDMNAVFTNPSVQGQLKVQAKAGLAGKAAVELLGMEVLTGAFETGLAASASVTARTNPAMVCTDVGAWVYAEAYLELLHGVKWVEPKLTWEIWNEGNSKVKLNWHWDDLTYVGGTEDCTWQAGVGDVSGVAPQASLDAYSWEQLKSISRAIAAASDDAAGLAIVKRYNLVDADGKLRGDTKAITLTDGTESHVRILGFRHDDLTSAGKAGISFEFSDVPATHQMNSTATNAGGWENCDMRRWLDADFFNALPHDLRKCIEAVDKKTNNTGFVGLEDTSVVTATSDKLWLLSMREVYGAFSGQSGEIPTYPAIYDAEGSQYQLYADQGVTSSSYSYCVKGGLTKKWWLRSPYPTYAEYFRGVYTGGGWSYSNDGDADGVSPGFCI